MEKVVALTGFNVKVKAYIELIKLKLTLAVVFSGVFGYCLAADHINWVKVAVLVVASIAITGAANIINQIIEKESDKVMKRTATRPLPTGRLTVSEAAVFAFGLFCLGTFSAGSRVYYSLFSFFGSFRTSGQSAGWRLMNTKKLAFK